MLRFIEKFLKPFDNDDRELVLRFRLWKMRWFPYRTAELIDFDENDNLILGPWEWYLPDKWKRWRKDA